jgi:hypothetical protein
MIASSRHFGISEHGSRAKVEGAVRGLGEDARRARAGAQLQFINFSLLCGKRHSIAQDKQIQLVHDENGASLETASLLKARFEALQIREQQMQQQQEQEQDKPKFRPKRFKVGPSTAIKNEFKVLNFLNRFFP